MEELSKTQPSRLGMANLKMSKPDKRPLLTDARPTASLSSDNTPEAEIILDKNPSLLLTINIDFTAFL